MIEVQGLTKIYPGNKGIKGISFRVAAGETFGFLGPNGAGKTTTIRLLMGFIKAQAGYARINGLDCWRDSTEIKRLVGYLPGEINFIENMSGEEFLNLMAGMHGQASVLRKRYRELADRWNLNLQQPIRKMSKGTKQKVGLVYAFMLDSPVLILDEPTSGLDPLMQKVFVDTILEEKSCGKTIFISSHIFPEIERTCDRVAMLKEGELIAIEDIHVLRQAQQRLFEIEAEDAEDVRKLLDSGLEIVHCERNRVTLRVYGDINPLCQILAGIRLKDFASQTADLEEAFLHFYLAKGHKDE